VYDFPFREAAPKSATSPSLHFQIFPVFCFIPAITMELLLRRMGDDIKYSKARVAVFL